MASRALPWKRPPRHRPAPPRRRAPRCGGLHQSRPRPSRLSRHDRSLCGGEAPPLRHAAAGRCAGRHQRGRALCGCVPAGRARSRTEASHHRQHGRDLASRRSARGRLFAGADRRSVRDRPICTTLPLLGAFQVENALVAAGLVLAVEGEGRAADVLEGFKIPQGRVGASGAGGRGGWRASASSITPTSPMRSPMCSMPCVPS